MLSAPGWPHLDSVPLGVVHNTVICSQTRTRAVNLVLDWVGLLCWGDLTEVVGCPQGFEKIQFFKNIFSISVFFLNRRFKYYIVVAVVVTTIIDS